MDFLIVTGLSGAGKSRAVDALEDIGFFCVDNLPPVFILKFAQIAMQPASNFSKVAIVTDVRGGDLFNDFNAALDTLDAEGIKYKLLFLECESSILVRRYKESRRRHPLLNNKIPSLEESITLERDLLMFARSKAHYIIDTSQLSSGQLRERINGIFLDNPSNSMIINCMSFGFKYSTPSEADLMFDVRCLPNPYYIDELKDKSGLDLDVYEYVMSFEQAKELKDKLFSLIDFLLPLYLSEGKSQLTIAVGCTGGKHRSVTFVESIYDHLLNSGHRVTVNHRDIQKN